MSHTEQIAQRIMRDELRRYAVPKDALVRLVQVDRPMMEESADGIELQMSYVAGFGLDATHETASLTLPGQLVRHPGAGLYQALRDGVAKMCRDLFGPHDGDGLP